MPWKPGDAARHSRGLTPRQQRIWARVANGALTRCTTQGGSAAACEGRAIRQANAVARRIPAKGMALGLAHAKVWAGAPDEESFKLSTDQAGYVEAAFSLFGKIDSDRDIVEPTAFKNGQKIPLTWAHDWQRPVGKGVISVEGKKQAVFKGNFFLNTVAGREAYETVKAMGDLQQWSWGFRVTDASMDTVEGENIRRIKSAEVFEVSPVLVGANRDTHTLAIKSGDYNDDGTDLDDDALSRLLDAVGEGEPSDGDESPTSDDSEGVPESDSKDGVAGENLTMEEEAEVALVATEGFTSRTAALVALRQSEGKVGRAISRARLERLNTLEQSLRQAANHIRDLVSQAQPKNPEDDEEGDEAPKKKPPTGDEPKGADFGAAIRLQRLRTERLRTAALSRA